MLVHVQTDLLMSLAVIDVMTICIISGTSSWINCECLENDSIHCCGLELWYLNFKGRAETSHESMLITYMDRPWNTHTVPLHFEVDSGCNGRRRGRIYYIG